MLFVGTHRQTITNKTPHVSTKMRLVYAAINNKLSLVSCLVKLASHMRINASGLDATKQTQGDNHLQLLYIIY